MSIYDDYYNFKYNFIDKKLKRYQIDLLINKKIIKNSLKDTSIDEKYFNQIMFHGITN